MGMGPANAQEPGHVAASAEAASPNPGLHDVAQPLPTDQTSHIGLPLRDSYIEDRVRLGAGQPLNVLALKDELELLRRDANIDAINAELAPGDVPGTSTLDLAVTEKNPFQFGVEYANNRPPSVGAYELDLLASDSNLTGNGDALSARWGVLAGAANEQQYNDDNDYSIDYLLPLTARNLTLELNYTRSSDVVEETPFQLVDIRSKTDSIFATLRQPIIDTVEDPVLGTKDQELAALFTVSSRYNRTFLLGEPFSFSPGAIDGKEDVFVLRPGVEYVRRSSEDALAMRGTVNVGISGPNTTLHENGLPQSRFVSFLGQAQYVHRVPLGKADDAINDTQGVLRFNTQLTPDRLLTLEQFSLGGVNTVRGYEENQVVRDMAVQASAELRMPIAKSNNLDILTVVPFFDSGYAWNRDNDQKPYLLSSVGVGLIFSPRENITASIYYGYRLKQFPHPTDDLQDLGISFDVTVLAF